MDIRINLLPPSERTSELPVRKLLFFIAAAVFLIMGTIYAFGMYTGWQLENKISSAKNQHELLRPTREKMIVANSKQQQISVKNNLLVALTKERRSWYAVLTHLGAIMPPQVWLTDLSLADKNSLRLKGMASTYPDMVRFMDAFKQDEILTEPLLMSADRDTASSATRFEMTVKFKGL